MKTVSKGASIAVPLVVFACAFATIMATVSDYGLTWDEPFYVQHSDRIAAWCRKLASSDAPFSEENIQQHWNYDRFHNCHPPFAKLAGIAVKNTVGELVAANPLHGYRLATAAWAGVLVALLALYLVRAHGSVGVALLGAALFLVTPRFFAHCHFYATDLPVASLAFLVLHVLAAHPGSWRWALVAGLAAGALLATKFTGVLVFPVAFAGILVAGHRKRFLWCYSLFFAVAWISFVLFDPYMWFGPKEELGFYFGSALGRFDFARISTAYFGRIYSAKLPWHHPFVMFAMVMPATVLPFILIGFCAAARDCRSPLHFFECVPFVILMIIFALPQTPKHDGIRLFSMVWPFIVILAVRGVTATADGIGVLARRFSARVDPDRLAAAVRLMLLVLCCLVSLAGIHRYHPYELSYYNGIIGGAGGAQRSGFTVSYWFEALDAHMLEEMDRVDGDASILVHSIPNPEIIEQNRALGLAPDGVIQVDSIEESDYILVLNRMLTPALCELIEKNEPAVLVSRDDGLIIGLFENSARRRPVPAGP